MLPGMEMLACPNLAVSPEVMQHIVRVESSANPYAIGVVDGQLERQPRNLAEALATARMLDAHGYNFSVGLAQVNRANLGRYGLNSYEDAFGACANLSAGAHILADCYVRARGDWGKAFSCYYSGNFTTGFRDGYVQKVYASIGRQDDPARASSANAGAIAVRAMPAPVTSAVPSQTETRSTATRAIGSTGNRAALRSMPIDLTAGATVPASTATQPTILTQTPSDADSVTTHSAGKLSNLAAMGAPQEIPPTVAATSAPIPATIASIGVESQGSVFVPRVRGADEFTATESSSEAAPFPSSPSSPVNGFSNATPAPEQIDAAFVF